MDNYYSKQSYPPPDEDQLYKALDLNQDKVVVVHEGDQLLGVAVFLTLTDETFDNIASIDMLNVNTLSRLLQEKGENIHFIMVTTKGIKNILAGLRAVVRERNAKSVSWFSPDMSRLHKHRLN
jgi:hypothetical protein